VDPTNASRAFARNRIRLDVVPALERAWPGARRALYDLAQEAAASRRAWSTVLREIEARIVTSEQGETIELARPLLLGYHPEIRTRLLRRWLARLGPAPNRTGTAAVAAFITAGASGSGIQLKGGLRVEREFDIVRVGRVRPAAGADRPLEIKSTHAGSGETMIGGTRYRIRWSIGADGDGLDTVAVDPDAVHFPLAIRSWQPGDRIGLPIGSKKLKKLFAEHRLGRQRRKTVPVLVDRTGRVLWVAGLVRSTAARPLPDHSALCITVSDGDTD
jgi:tRNA(Ile)-lysidine synthase